jgi:DNA-binding CsgD family transcriptional regulator
MHSPDAAQIAQTVAAMLDAPESSLLVVGEPGSGKSHLLDRLRAHPSLATVVVRANPVEAGFPVSGVSAMLAELRGDHRGELVRHLDVRSDDPVGLFAAGHDLVALLAGMRLPPTLVLLDDVDLMDEVSQSLLGTVASRLPGTNLRMVLTSTTPPAGGPFAALRTLTLAPLSHYRSQELVQTLIGDADPALVPIVAHFAGGNPKLLTEQLSLLGSDQLDGSTRLALPLRPSPTLDAVAEKRLNGLEPALRRPLAAAALAPLAHREALLSLDPRWSGALEDLVDLGLLRALGPHVVVTDPRVRTHLYWSQSGQRRRSLHAALAEAAADEPRIAAWHLSFVDGLHVHATTLVEAAVELAEENHVWPAVEYAERAAGVPTGPEHGEALSRLVVRLLERGETSLAGRYVRDIDLALTPEPLRLMALRLTIELLDVRRTSDEMVNALVDAEAADEPEAAVALLELTTMSHVERWQPGPARAQLERLREISDLPPARAAEVDQLADVLDALEGKDPDPAHVPPEQDPRTMPTGHLVLAGRAATLRQQHTLARRLFTVVLTRRQSANAVWSQLARYGQVLNETRAGHLRRGRAAIDDWEENRPWTFHGPSEAAYIGAWCAWSNGELERSRELIEVGLSQAQRHSAPSVHARLLSLLGATHVLGEDWDAALEVLRRAHAEGLAFRDPALLRHGADYVEACVRTGRAGEGRSVLTLLEQRVGPQPSPWSRIALARARGLLLPVAEAVPHLAQVVAHAGPDTSPYELGRTLTTYADRLAEAGEVDEARRIRMLADATFERSGAHAWAERLAEQLKPAERDPYVEAVTALSEEERHIVRLAMAGRRTRDIAADLHLSVRSVELRLTRIYRTIGVASRAQLVAVLDGRLKPTD